MKSSGSNRRSRKGFTLLELLTVMAIMMLLMGLTAGAIYGFLRGAGMNSAVHNLRSTLSLARQYAVTHRSKTHVMFWQDGTNSHYVVCAEEGTHIGGPGIILRIHPPRWAGGALTGGDIFNVTTEEHGTIVTNSTYELWATNSRYAGGIPWRSGEKYGWAVRAQVHLPEGITFGNGLPASAPPQITFNPDGTAPLLPPPGYIDIDIKEMNTATPATKTIRVQGLTGQVKVGPPF